MTTFNCLLFLFLLIVSISGDDEDAFIGVNIGSNPSRLPSPSRVVELLQNQQIKHIRLLYNDKTMLQALANTGIQITLSVPNDQILKIGQSNLTAANWVTRNIIPHFPATKITSISVGSEVLTRFPIAAPVLVSAIQFIHSTLVASNLDSQIKVSTPHSSSIILDSFYPSQAFFNQSMESVIFPLLKFLNSTDSFFMLNLYPYYDHIRSNTTIPLEYALFRPLPPNKQLLDPNTLLHYTNSFDAIVDAAYFAMSNLNFTDIPIVVTESGWPSNGDSYATLDNANTYNSNLINHILNKTGTPNHPGIAVNTYIFELYNEDPVVSQNWGLFDSDDGVPIYTLNLTGSGTVFVNDTSSEKFCVVRRGADHKKVLGALDWVCGIGKVDCSPIMKGQPCYDPNTVIAHASYVFDVYYKKMDMAAGTCDFNGVAIITTKDPSTGTCLYTGRLIP